MANDYADQEARDLIDKQFNLPSPPAIAVKILSTVQQQDFALEDLEKIISADAALTGKMLRIANSAFYSLPKQVSNVNRALSLLGTNVIKNIALSFVIANDLQDAEDSCFNFNYFWRRSVTAAVAAELVTKELGEPNEDIFVTALLQDLGVLLMYLFKGEEYANTLKNCIINGGRGLPRLEKEKYRFDHQQLGYLLLENWGLPNSITGPMRFHHEPQAAPEKIQRVASILNTANTLSAIYSGTESAENFRELQKKMEDYFSIGPEKTREILDTVAVQTVAILEIFELDNSNIKPYSELLQEANDELGKLNLSYEQLVLELKESKEKTERFANELREANSRLEELAFRDGLTNLYNHRYFQEILDKEIARALRYNHPLGLIMFDIDFFKKVNDTYGHPGGDKVLKNIANRISEIVRPSDLVARYGGEEFTVILPETERAGLEIFAERLRTTVEETVTKVGQSLVKVTVSCGGIQLNPASPLNKQQFIDLADQSLYQAKTNGRNQVVIAHQ